MLAVSKVFSTYTFYGASELRSWVKVEVAVLRSLYLISLVVSVDVKQH